MEMIDLCRDMMPKHAQGLCFSQFFSFVSSHGFSHPFSLNHNVILMNWDPCTSYGGILQFRLIKSQLSLHIKWTKKWILHSNG
jgi:hypothetical protein